MKWCFVCLFVKLLDYTETPRQILRSLCGRATHGKSLINNRSGLNKESGFRMCFSIFLNIAWQAGQTRFVNSRWVFWWIVIKLGGRMSHVLWKENIWSYFLQAQTNNNSTAAILVIVTIIISIGKMFGHIVWARWCFFAELLGSNRALVGAMWEDAGMYQQKWYFKKKTTTTQHPSVFSLYHSYEQLTLDFVTPHRIDHVIRLFYLYCIEMPLFYVFCWLRFDTYIMISRSVCIFAVLLCCVLNLN